LSKAASRILYITSSWPHGKSFGGQLRALHIGRALRKIGDVTLMVVSSDDLDDDVVKKTASEFEVLQPVRVKTAPNRSVVQRLRWAFDTQYLNVHGCAADDADRARLVNSLGDFDLLWVLNSRTPNILNQWHWPRSVLDLDDVPSTFHRSVWQNGSDPKRRLKAGIQSILSTRRERFWKERFSVLSVCSEADRQQLGGGPHIHVIPNGFERPLQMPVPKPSNPPRIGFIGLYSYPPNLEGMKWFLRECWPQIKQQVPDARLRLAGKDTDGPLRPDGADIDALGWIDDPAEEIATWSLTVIPLLHGAGTRIKLADAFSRKCPVVSTSLGAFGYEVEHGRELLLADKPAEFANACVSLIRNPERGSQLAENAFSAFLKKWTWDAIEPRIHAAAEDALSQQR
jgi:glycosyltransferase involved in cell wall biosynthesis